MSDLQDLLDMADLSDREEYQNKFDRIAKELLNSYKLVTLKKSYRIREIEFYYYDENHTDFYCHKNLYQLNNSTFYFHRFKNPEKYLRLRQKGIDITFGDKEKNYGGILIRAIQNVGSGVVITGIGKLTNQIIDDIGGSNEIVKLQDTGNNIFKESSSLRLLRADMDQLKIFKKRRQGLNIKNSDLDRFYLDAAYNYFTYPEIQELL